MGYPPRASPIPCMLCLYFIKLISIISNLPIGSNCFQSIIVDVNSGASRTKVDMVLEPIRDVSKDICISIIDSGKVDLATFQEDSARQTWSMSINCLHVMIVRKLFTMRFYDWQSRRCTFFWVPMFKSPEPAKRYENLMIHKMVCKIIWHFSYADIEMSIENSELLENRGPAHRSYYFISNKI